MLYLIDGYNWLLSTSKEDFISDDHLRVWIQQQTALLHSQQLRAILIFDAQKRRGPLHRFDYNDIDVIFTSFGQTADELILEMISSLPRAMAHVITSDRDLGRCARALGAQTTQVKPFLRRLAKSKKRDRADQKGLEVKNFQLIDESIGSDAWARQVESAYFQRLFEIRYRQRTFPEQCL